MSDHSWSSYCALSAGNHTNNNHFGGPCISINRDSVYRIIANMEMHLIYSEAFISPHPAEKWKVRTAMIKGHGLGIHFIQKKGKHEGNTHTEWYSSDIEWERCCASPIVARRSTIWGGIFLAYNGADWPWAREGEGASPIASEEMLNHCTSRFFFFFFSLNGIRWKKLGNWHCSVGFLHLKENESRQVRNLIETK